MAEVARHGLCVPAGHPVFAGHFPDAPLVPAVMLLAAVAEALAAERGQVLGGVREAKFLAPLLPDVAAEVTLEALDTRRTRFLIRTLEAVIARGIVEGAA